MIKECGFLEQLVISFIMLPNILGRALCLGVIFGLLKIHGAIVLIIVFVSQTLLSCLETLLCKTKVTSRMFLGILTSFTSPCLIVIEQSKHFLVNGITGTVLYIMATWIIYFNASAIRRFLPNSNFTLECHGDVSDITNNSIIRCSEITLSEDTTCYPGIFSVSNSTNQESLYTICPESYDQWHFLLIACTLVTGLLGLSLISVIFLYYLIKCFNVYGICIINKNSVL